MPRRRHYGALSPERSDAQKLRGVALSKGRPCARPRCRRLWAAAGAAATQCTSPSGIVPWSTSHEPECACPYLAHTLIRVRCNFMRRNSGSNRRLWRGLVGCVLAYALVLNALLSGVLGAEWAAQAAAGLLDQHCLTDTVAASDSSDQAPVQHPGDQSHCAFCTLAATPAVLPSAASSATIVQYRAAVSVDVSDHDRPYLRCYTSRLPRGPPQRA
jgi:hypothetical protein